MIVLPALIVNFPVEAKSGNWKLLNEKFDSYQFLPIITNVIFSQSLDSSSQNAAIKQETPVARKVDENSHFLPVFMMMYIAIPMAGISTKPASACVWEREKIENCCISSRGALATVEFEKWEEECEWNISQLLLRDVDDVGKKMEIGCGPNCINLLLNLHYWHKYCRQRSSCWARGHSRRDSL